MLLVGAIRLGFVLAKNCGVGGGGQVSARGTMHMVAALAAWL